MTPAVSVLVPAFRAQAHIARAVASVLAQTMPAWELIIIADDGQDYAPVLHAQGITDPRIRFASSGAVRSGCARPRNVGLSLARAPIIAMLDADDLFY
ncbi:MAG: glycosyltransferase, partial [Alphaproteobacteria bacterium]|nr:glycosyltransferase [Alphaproteobacteria bacterium]